MVIAPNSTTGSTALAMTSVLRQTPQYTYLKGLFDQVRIAAVRLKLIPTWQVAMTDSSRLTQVTAWDRDGCSTRFAG